MPATLSLITTTMRGTAQERAVGLWASIATLGGALGLIFGGLVLEFADWSAILYVSGAAALLVAAAGLLVEESADPARPRFDLLGGVTGAAAIGLAVFGINEAPSHGWASGVVQGCLLSGLALALVFAVLELRREHPLLDIRIFRSRQVLTGSLVLVALFAVLYAYFFLVMQYLQLIEAMSPLTAGLWILPCAITMFPLALLAPALVGRYGLRWVTTLAMLPLVASMLLMADIAAGDSTTFAIAILLMGVTFGLCITPATVAILRSVPPGKQGVASAVNDAVREVGAALGIAVVGSILATGYSRDLGPAVHALPEPARGTAEASLAGALQVGEQLGPAAGPAVAEAREAFLSGMHGAFLACAVFIMVCALTVALAAPGTQVDGDRR
jgi:predicted MFS family arabinose efflux permease